jgi:hypothetical protein
LLSAWGTVLKLVKHGRDVLGHGYVNKMVVIVPVDGKAKEKGTCDVIFERVQLVKSVKKMICVFVTGELDAKVGYNQGELDGSGAV